MDRDAVVSGCVVGIWNLGMSNKCPVSVHVHVHVVRFWLRADGQLTLKIIR